MACHGAPWRAMACEKEQRLRQSRPEISQKMCEDHLPVPIKSDGGKKRKPKSMVEVDIFMILIR